MDDIHPYNSLSPAVIHVVDYSEATELTSPSILAESSQITRAAIFGHRQGRQTGAVLDMSNNADVAVRSRSIVKDVEALLVAIERMIPSPYSPEGPHQIFSAGFLFVPGPLGERDDSQMQ